MLVKQDGGRKIKPRRCIMALRKIDIVDQIHGEIGLTRKECATVVDSLFEIMKDELSQRKTVKISGFGKWVVTKKHARKGRNPQTGEAITIGARKVVSFKASNILRKALT
jgi:integration host factor subunit alpha